MTQNQIQYWSMKDQREAYLEQARHNLAVEAETQRSNRAREAFDLSNLQETNRSNIAREQETNRANVARETETNRSNLSNEGLKRVDLSISSNVSAENRRHNLASETLTQERQFYQNNLDAARTEQQTLENDWTATLNSGRVRVTEAQIQQYNSQSRYLEMQYIALNDALNRRNFDQAQEIWKNINGSLNVIAKIVDSVIPG